VDQGERAIETNKPCPLCEGKYPPKRLQRHLGKNLEQIALFVIPGSMKDEDDDEEEEEDKDEEDDQEDGNDEDKNEEEDQEDANDEGVKYQYHCVLHGHFFPKLVLSDQQVSPMKLSTQLSVVIDVETAGC
jgi:hypothetical protein